METEEKLLETLKDWQFLTSRLSRLKIDLLEKGYKITASFSDAKVFSTGDTTSKLESYCFARMKMENEIDDLERRLHLCMKAYRDANLTNLEKTTIRYTCSGRSLLKLSRSLNMAQAKIYRIRDKAVKKMYLMIQNEIKSR